MLQYPLLITWPKARDCLYNKGEIDMKSNLVTESKVTECNRMSLTILCRNHATDSAGGMWTRLPQRSCPEHASEMPKMCPGTRKAHTLLKK